MSQHHWCICALNLFHFRTLLNQCVDQKSFCQWLLETTHLKSTLECVEGVQPNGGNAHYRCAESREASSSGLPICVCCVCVCVCVRAHVCACLYGSVYICRVCVSVTETRKDWNKERELNARFNIRSAHTHTHTVLYELSPVISGVVATDLKITG